MKPLSYLFVCVLMCIPVVVVNSQPNVNNVEVKSSFEKVKLSPNKKAKLLRELHQKEAENRNLKIKIKVNEQEINELLGQLIETKSDVKKRSPIYKRIFTHRNKKEVLPGIITEPIPVKIDTALEINKVDTVSVIVPIAPKREAFFKRLFHKVFKRKNKNK